MKDHEAQKTFFAEPHDPHVVVMRRNTDDLKRWESSRYRWENIPHDPTISHNIPHMIPPNSIT